MPEVPVIVEWRDCTFSSQTFTPKEAREWGLLCLSTIGFLVHEDDEKVVLTQERQTNRESEDQYRHVIAIPRVNITKVTLLEALDA